MIYHVFANKKNVGDWLSARRIQSLLAPFEVHELFCDSAFTRASLRTLAGAGERDLIVIGGGGLFQDYFIPFWAGFEAIAERVPFCIWGVGVCGRIGSESPLIPLVRRILARARFTVVRDGMTRAAIDPDRLPPPVPCPGLTLAADGSFPRSDLLHAVHPDLLGSDDRAGITATTRSFATASGRAYHETTNIIASGSEAEFAAAIELYARAELVVSSRLHGCIIGLASGCKVLALSSDPKVDHFMRVAGLGDWVCDPRDLASLALRLRQLPDQPKTREFIRRAVSANQSIAREIRNMIEINGVQTQPDPSGAQPLAPCWDTAWRRRVADRIAGVIPRGAAFLLVDENVFAGDGPGPPAGSLPFPAVEGEYWGPPATDADAIEELERRRHDSNPAFLVFVAPAFWWLDHYQDFARDLRARFRTAVETDDVVAFDLRIGITRNTPAPARPDCAMTRQAATAIAIPAGTTADYERWSSLASFHQGWDGRTQLMARLIPAGARVIEFGAGRRQLERYLDPSCVYFPSDLIERGPGTIVCDLNVRPLPDLRGMRLDVGVFSGVLEYLTDLPEIARWLAGQVPTCAISYACAKATEIAADRPKERAARARNGWVNTYTETELLAIFEAAGFTCRIRQPWKEQQVFRLESSCTPAATVPSTGGC